VIEHCVAFFRKKKIDEAYRIYITDTLKAIAENTSKEYGGQYPKLRYADMIKAADVKETTQETRTPQEIITGMKNKLNRLAGD
jgi:DNA-binding ferritin-like protein